VGEETLREREKNISQPAALGTFFTNSPFIAQRRSLPGDLKRLGSPGFWGLNTRGMIQDKWWPSLSPKGLKEQRQG